MSLVLEGVTKSFGGLRATSDVSFSVADGVIFGLIGPNGAGKSTVFNLITGVYRPDSGTITFGARDLTALKPAQIAGVGIGRTFQNIRLFGQLTVIENLLVACEGRKKAHLAAAMLRLPAHYEDEAAMHARAIELLRIFDLHGVADESPTALSYGNQRRLEIARAMMLNPKLLLLDEPAAGMNYGEAEGLKTQLRWLRDTFDLSIVLVEHNMQVVMGVCEELHVLDHGETIANGTPEHVRADPRVIAAYLGEEETTAVGEEPSRPSPALLAPSSAAASPRAKPMSVEALEDLSRDLARSMERGLSKPDAIERRPDTASPLAVAMAPATERVGDEVGASSSTDGPVGAPPAAPSSRAIRLSNVDRGWSSSDMPVAALAPVAASSTPELSKLDTGWGSDAKLPVVTNEDDAKGEP